MKKRRAILLAVLGLVVICVVVLLAVYLLLRSRALEERPLVLIHSPIHLEETELGDGLLVHATARSESGVARIELWADGEFVAAREQLERGPVSLMVLTAGYQPLTRGSHTLVVRATSAGGVDGQATVAIQVIEAVAKTGDMVGTHFVTNPDETLESIAEEYGTTEEELEELNPELAAEGLEPGDGVHYPEEGPPSGAEPEPDEPVEPSGDDREPARPPEDEEPPSADDDAPGSITELSDLMGFVWPFPAPFLGDNTVTLQAEALALETNADYESVHCYIGIGEVEPLWYPDADYDQATDESFESLGDGQWDIAAHLSETGAPVITWPSDEWLPINITCVAIGGGGSEPLDLGRLEITVRPEAWDGVTRRAVGAGEDGTFTLDYRVAETESAPGRGIPCWDDPTMTIPTNARLDTRRYSLRWDYHADEDEDEEPIHGFRIYLNNVLQWTEGPDARESGLPPEWFNPPCGDEYRFTVRAFRYGFPDGPESYPSNMARVSGGDPDDDACMRRVIVTFTTLETFGLPGDGRTDPGDIGPVYGNFYAGDQEVTFDGRCEGSGFCDVFALHEDREYDISAITSYYGSGSARVIVAVPFGEDLEMGFDIRDGDTHNADDDVCGDFWYVFDSDLDRAQSTSMRSNDLHCRLRYTVEPLGDTPVVEPGALPPLPLLAVTNLTVDEATGDLMIHIRNNGAAGWPAHDLDIALFTPSGTGIGAYTERDFFMEAGDSRVLRSEVTPDPPLDACILLDPGNEIPEEDDRSPGWTRGRYCRDLPDLEITDVGYDPNRDRLLVTIRNIGEGTLEHRNIGMRINTATGAEFLAPREWWSDVNLERWHSAALEWIVAEDPREEMLEGYQVVLDPGNDIAEEDDSNNTYDVRGQEEMQIMWRSGTVPYYYGGTNRSRMYFDAYVIGAGGSRNVAYWTSPEMRSDDDTVGGSDGWYDLPDSEGEYDYQVWYFDLEIMGDEKLEIRMSAFVEIVGRRDAHLGLPREVFEPDEDWGARLFGYQACNVEGHPEDGGVHGFWVQPLDSGLPAGVHGRAWRSTFTICMLE